MLWIFISALEAGKKSAGPYAAHQLQALPHTRVDSTSFVDYSPAALQPLRRTSVFERIIGFLIYLTTPAADGPAATPP